jgi:hypothetical protein
VGTTDPFPGGKARPGRDTDHSPPSSAEVMNEELYVLSPPWRCMAVVGQLYLFISLPAGHWGSIPNSAGFFHRLNVWTGPGPTLPPIQWVPGFFPRA